MKVSLVAVVKTDGVFAFGGSRFVVTVVGAAVVVVTALSDVEAPVLFFCAALLAAIWIALCISCFFVRDTVDLIRRSRTW